MNEPSTAGQEGRLDSWKKIAAYLKRDVSTVQRWERREAMPVHRHLHDKQGSVYAFRSELDAWWGGRSARLAREQSSVAETATAGDQDAPRAHRHLWLWWAAAAVLACASLGWWQLVRTEYFWKNPLANAQYRSLTDIEGTQNAAAMSRDGTQVAFLSDRDGPMDVWVTQVGSGRFQNLTRGSVPELVNPSIRTLGFSPDAALVSIWTRQPDGSRPEDISLQAAPTAGGSLRR